MPCKLSGLTAVEFCFCCWVVGEGTWTHRSHNAVLRAIDPSLATPELDLSEQVCISDVGLSDVRHLVLK